MTVILPVWVRAMVACALALWLAYDIGEITFRVTVGVMAVLWALWALASAGPGE